MKLYVVKYFLTKGIIEFDKYEISNQDKKYIYPKEYGFMMSCKLGRDCTFDYEEAKKMAKKMVEKKITSLEKRIEKLKRMRDGM